MSQEEKAEKTEQNIHPTLAHYKEFVETGKKPVAGGMDIPVLDFYAPSRKQLWDGLREHIRNQSRREEFVEEAFKNVTYNTTAEQFRHNYYGKSTGRSEPVENILDAISALTALESYFYTNKIPDGAKIPLDPEEPNSQQHIEDLFEVLSAGARTINNLEINKDIERKIQIRKPGGTIFNKLHAMLDTSGKIFGLIGKNNETGRRSKEVRGNKDLIEESLKKSDIDLWPGGETAMEETKHSFVYITGKEGAKKRDRIILKTEAEKAAQLLANTEPAEFIEGIDIALIEGSAISDGKFGQDLFRKMADAVMESDKEIIFAPPTNQDLLYLSEEKKKDMNLDEINDKEAEIKSNIELFNNIIDHKNTTMLTMNESEAIQMFTKHGYGAENKDQKVSGKNDPDLKDAREAIQERLQAKKEAMGDSGIEPMALVSVGTHGAYAITADKMEFMEGRFADPFIDSLGAGDAFAGAGIHERNEIIFDKLLDGKDKVYRTKKGDIEEVRESATFVESAYNEAEHTNSEDRIITFNKSDLRNILKKAQGLAKEVVEQKGAQLPIEKVKDIYYGKPGIAGHLAVGHKLPEQEITM